jgi:hypothetical protein
VTGPGPGFTAFNLSDAQHPQLIPSPKPLSKRFFQTPVYSGNYAFSPTYDLQFFLGFQWDDQLGDLVAVDLTNPGNPAVVGTLAQPQISPSFGGESVVLGATQADPGLVYLGGSSSTGGANNGTGRFQVVDISNPAAMKTVGQMLIPGTILFNAPLIQGTVAVGIGNTGGWVGGLTSSPPGKGNIVVTTFDVSDRRAPAILSITTTTYTVGVGAGAARIGNNLFAFAGVVDTNNNNVLLLVDVTNPSAPVIQSVAIPQPFTSMQTADTKLYATLGSAGFAIYSIPGIGNDSSLICPASIDAMVVVDRGINAPSQTFLDAKAALKSFIDSLHLPTDQVGVASFTNAATVDQVLTTDPAPAMAAFDGIIPGGISYIGAGIVAAQTELSSARRNPSATPIIVIVSDGGDAGAPTPNSTLAAANAAKAAGMRIVSVQYGAGGGTLMQSIASSSADYFVVAP